MNKSKLFFTLLMLSLPLVANSDDEEQRQLMEALPEYQSENEAEANAHANAVAAQNVLQQLNPVSVPGTPPMVSLPIVGTFSVTPDGFVGQTHVYEDPYSHDLDIEDDIYYDSDLDVEDVDSDSDDEDTSWISEE